MESQLATLESQSYGPATAALARTYLAALAEWLPELPAGTALACAYIAAGHTHDAAPPAPPDAPVAARDVFWRGVERAEDYLVFAARLAAKEGDGGGFVYERLPRYSPRCATCEEGNLPCLVARGTAPGGQREGASRECQVCYVRHAECRALDSKDEDLKLETELPSSTAQDELLGASNSKEFAPIPFASDAPHKQAPDAQIMNGEPANPPAAALSAPSDAARTHLALAYTKELEIVEYCRTEGGEVQDLRLKVPIREMGHALRGLGGAQALEGLDAARFDDARRLVVAAARGVVGYHFVIRDVELRTLVECLRSRPASLAAG